MRAVNIIYRQPKNKTCKKEKLLLENISHQHVTKYCSIILREREREREYYHATLLDKLLNMHQKIIKECVSLDYKYLYRTL